uniref:BED-type domain-containing protein n=1 Tax=Parastrongyloides trichosuri TaxID=131310 RepID=A0A0N5A546_PARTI
MDLQTESTKLPRFDVDSLSHLLKMENSITLPSSVNPKLTLRTRPVPSPRFHSKISEVWKHYHMPDPTSFQVICFHCGKRMKRSDSSTKSMWGHLKAFHKDLVGQETFDMKIRKRKAVRNEYNNNNIKDETIRTTSTPRTSPSSNIPSGSSTSREDTENDATLSSPSESSTVQKLFLSDLLNRMAQKTTNPLLNSATCGLNDVNKTNTPLSNDKMNLLPLDLFPRESTGTSVEASSTTTTITTTINITEKGGESSNTGNKPGDNETQTSSISFSPEINTPTQPYVKRNRAGGFQNPYGLSSTIPASQSNALFNGTTSNAVDVFAQLAATQMKSGDVSGIDFKNDTINFLGNLPISNDLKIKTEENSDNNINSLAQGIHGMKSDTDEPMTKKVKPGESLDINGLLGLQNGSFMLNKIDNQHNVNEMLGQLSTMNPFIFAAAMNQSNNVGGAQNLLQQLTGTSQASDISNKPGTSFANGLVSPPKQPTPLQPHNSNIPSNFSLSDNSCIQSLISIARDMNIVLTYASDSNGDEFTLSTKGSMNIPNFSKKSVVLKDYPDEIKIYERTADLMTESEAWRKTEWSQMQWALRGKVQNILFK